MTPANAARAPTANVGQTLLWLVALAALLLAVLLWQRLGRVQDQLVHKSLASAARADEAQAQARQALQVAQAAMPRLAVAEGSLDDLQAWRQQADELLKTAARARDDSLVADLAAMLQAAQAQSRLSGDASALQTALQAARARISQAANPRLAAAARAARQDLERVQSAEWPDVNHLLAQLDALWGQMDGLPVAHEWAGAITHEITRESAPASAEKAADAASDAAATSWWQRAWAEAAQLVRVSRIEPPDAGVMSAQQTALMRQHVKMRVQGARLALLAGRRDAAQAELARAAQMAAALFDAQAPAARDALARLQQAQSALQGGASVPGAAATLAALAEAAQVDAPAAAEANTGASHDAHDAHDARTGDF